MTKDQPGSKEIEEQLHIKPFTSEDINAMAFPKTDVPASSNQTVILHKQLDVVPTLDTSDVGDTFSLQELATSSATGGTVITSAAGDQIQGFTLVGSDGGEFVVMSSGSDSINVDSASIIQQGGQAISLNLEEATRYLVQQQGINLGDGTFQILEQPVVQVQREDGTLESQTLHIEVLQALQGDLAQQMPVIDSVYTIPSNIDNLDETSSIPPNIDNLDETSSIPPNMDSLDETSSSSVVKLKTPPDVAEESQNEDSIGPVEFAEPSSSGLPGITNISQEIKEGEDKNSNDDLNQDKIQQNKEPKKITVKKEGEKKEPDLNSPIPLSDETIITVKGKKCVLSYNEETQQVCAYPLKPPPGTKRRGRPKMTEEEKSAAAERKRKQQLAQLEADTEELASPSEKSTAAETLLELSNVGSDGVRRSGRKRKKAKLLEEYEELEDSGEEDDQGFDDNREKDPDISLNLPEMKKKKIVAPIRETVGPKSAVLVTTPTQTVKRGRGRPRRYPPPGQQQNPTSIPAVMIPSANGRTLVMAPIQGLQNLQNFRRQLPNLVPKPLVDANTSSIALTPSSSSCLEGSDSNPLSLGNDTDALPLDTSGVLDSNSIIPTALQGETIPLVGDNTETSDQADTMDAPSSGLLGFMTPTSSGTDQTKTSQTAEGSDRPGQPTVLQIPGSLLATLGFKKDPVKIGLKASERELERLKCPKCDFQGYYVQQYRNHIATHGEDIQKCKCCSYLSLDSEELLEHFKEYHPRCICTECGYMAEHAYIIKRHMMRHDTKSCTCHMCGKVYKDMYILKMHIKMVHMPAEVLFECNVCSKKFTRKAHLKRHLRIHEPEKPYKCPICDYRGCERSDISKHMLIHEEPKHTCERCGKTFRHIKNKELHVKRHFGQRDYKCGVCDFFGYTFTDIRKHIERKHQDIKTMMCDKCNKHFRSEIALKEHQQTCNVMVIEQVLAIPTSEGGTSQATIQIPTNLGPDGQIILDGQTIKMEGQTIAVNKHGEVNIMVAGDHQLEMGEEGVPGEEEEELDEEDGGIKQAMQLISETIMTETGEEMHIIAQEALGSSGQILSHDELQDQIQQGHILDEHGQLISSSSIHIVNEHNQIIDQHGQVIGQRAEIIDHRKQLVEESEEPEGEVQEMAQQFIHEPDQGVEHSEENVDEGSDTVLDGKATSPQPTNQEPIENTLQEMKEEVQS